MEEIIKDDVSKGSFVRVDPSYHSRRNYDRNNKVLPESQLMSTQQKILDPAYSQSTHATQSSQLLIINDNKCLNCGKVTKSSGGLKLHLRKCMERGEKIKESKNNVFISDIVKK